MFHQALLTLLLPTLAFSGSYPVSDVETSTSSSVPSPTPFPVLSEQVAKKRKVRESLQTAIPAPVLKEPVAKKRKVRESPRTAITAPDLSKLVSLSSLYAKGYFQCPSEKLFAPDHKLNMNVAIWKGGMKVNI
jgi:hypothetical protein